MAEIHLTKLAGARRQLCSAIRMYFAGEDDLAIHTVASAAYQVISDLKKKRGRNEVSDYYLTMIFYAIRDYRRGTLPGYLADDHEAMKWIRELAERIPITETSKFEDIKASVPQDVMRQFWKKRNKIYNFLKHADNDANNHISMGDVDNLSLLVQAHSFYFDIDGNGLGNEGLVLWMFFCVEFDMIETLPTRLHEIASHLEPLSHVKRLKWASMFLDELNEKKEDT